VHVTDAKTTGWTLRLTRGLVASLLIACLSGTGTLMAAAITDVNEDIIYSADGGGSIETVDTTRTTTLRGNVRIQQGMVTIFGDTARLEQDTNTGDLIRVTVEGQPARFTREGEAGTETITGSSTQIVYYNEPAPASAAQTGLVSVVEFIGDANFQRGRTALQCVQIKHIVETGATDSPGPCSGVFAPAVEQTTAAEQP
jgi:lipopolysaccharide transport protein LptA